MIRRGTPGDGGGDGDGDEPRDAELEAQLDEEFPLGDGTAETAAVVDCPWCGEANEIGLDPGSGTVQDYVEDCQVCCRPWRVRVAYLADGTADVTLTPLGE